jgi:dipeptidyl aminopeptidase/acylaminoacyl peptidase
VILLQGDEDKVVPPDQAETMFKVLTSKGLPSSLVIYKGEQHGFRKSENISHALLSEYYFFCKTFGIEPQSEGNFSGVEIGARVEV